MDRRDRGIEPSLGRNGVDNSPQLNVVSVLRQAVANIENPNLNIKLAAQHTLADIKKKFSFDSTISLLPSSLENFTEERLYEYEIATTILAQDNNLNIEDDNSRFDLTNRLLILMDSNVPQEKLSQKSRANTIVNSLDILWKINGEESVPLIIDSAKDSNKQIAKKAVLLLRNVKDCLNPDFKLNAISTLKEIITSTKSDIEDAAIISLGYIQDPNSIGFLNNLLKKKHYSAPEALSFYRDNSTPFILLNALYEELSSPNRHPRTFSTKIIGAIGRSRNPLILTPLLNLLNENILDDINTIDIVYTIGKFRDHTTIPTLGKILYKITDDNPIRNHILRVFREIGHPNCLPYLLDVLHKTSNHIKYSQVLAFEGFVEIADPLSIISEAGRLLNGNHTYLTPYIIQTVGNKQLTETLDLIYPYLDGTSEERAAAIKAIVMISPDVSVKTINKTLKDPNLNVITTTCECIIKNLDFNERTLSILMNNLINSIGHGRGRSMAKARMYANTIKKLGTHTLNEDAINAWKEIQSYPDEVFHELFPE